jgi:hypothetical protein
MEFEGLLFGLQESAICFVLSHVSRVHVLLTSFCNFSLILSSNPCAGLRSGFLPARSLIFTL